MLRLRSLRAAPCAPCTAAGSPAGPSNKLAGVVSTANLLAAANLIGEPGSRQQAVSVAPLLKRLLDLGVDSTLRVYFGQWKLAFDKTYPDRVEEAKRYAIWKDNLRATLISNIDLGSMYWKRLTAYSDMTKDEFQAGVLVKLNSGARHGLLAAAAADGTLYRPKLSAQANDRFNWADLGKVSPVRKQVG